jgi:hypothetical protein
MKGSRNKLLLKRLCVPMIKAREDDWIVTGSGLMAASPNHLGCQFKIPWGVHLHPSKYT